jgi:amphi-Trp domain-containing protein
MSTTRKSHRREVEKSYSAKQLAAKLRRLADCLEQRRAFPISVAGRRVTVPADAKIVFELEREGKEQELEIQLTWMG